MSGVSVVVPWRSGCPHREAAWEWVRGRYEQTGWQVIEGSCGDGEWCKAEAVADGIARATGDIIVIADADCWTDGVGAGAAVVAAGAPWCSPYCQVRRLTERATGDVLGGARLTVDLPLEQQAYGGMVAGGVTVLRREVWDDVPMDRRFTGWGQEDTSFGFALTGLVGRPVMFGWQGWPLWHLWHPPQPRLSRSVGNQAGFALERRYRTERNSPARLRRLVEEGRPSRCLSSHSPT